MTRELVAAGAKVNARTKTALMKGALGRIIRRPGGETALHLAAAAGNAAVIRVLLQAGADVEAKAEDGRAPLDYAIRLGAVTEAAEALVEAGAPLTPERLDLMHSSAHNPEADLLMFPSSTAGTDALPPNIEVSAAARNAHQAANQQKDPPVELRCPTCHALIYSRKPKLCGQCGAFLPAELLIDDLQAQALAAERKWARELAAKFDGQSPGAPPPERSYSGLSGNRHAIYPQQLLRGVSCAQDFRHRERPAFWLYLVGYGLMFLVVSYIPLQLGAMPAKGLLLMAGMFALLVLRAWCNASPLCPNCHQNIRLCLPEYCQGCGQPLNRARCNDCGVNGGWIRYCPGCGVQLDSHVLRWHPRE